MNSQHQIASAALFYYAASMPLVESTTTSRYQITAYTDDAVFINGQRCQTSLILSAETLLQPWPAMKTTDLTAKNLQAILDLAPEVVLLGTGKQQTFPDAAVFAHFGHQGIGLEVMDNGALCRTFNILVAEDRAVVAAILLDT